MRFRPYPLLTLCTIASLIVLGWLGCWQYGRYEEKLAWEDVPLIETAPVSVSVETLTDAPAQNVYGIADGEAIWRRYAPGRINGVGDPVLVLWDAVGGVRPQPLDLSGLGTIERESAVFIRPVAKPRFGQRNDPEADTWYAFDGPAMLAAFGFEAETVRVVEPVTLTVRNGENLSQTRTTKNPYRAPRPVDPLPPQRHFGYALTWWGLGAALIGVYIAFHVARGRLSFRS